MKSIDFEKKVIKAFLSLINPLLWIIKWFIPKKPNLILFQAANYDVYSDNARYLFEYMSYNSNKKCYWITRNYNLEKYLFSKNLKYVHHPSFKSIYYFLRCDIIISGETSPPSGNGFLGHFSFKINVSHGFGPRSINSPDGKMYKSAKSVCNALNKFDVMGFSSLFTRNLIGKGLFLLPEAKTIVTGLPRCDHLLDKQLCDFEVLNKKYCREKFKNINSQSKVLLYAPTWRQNFRNPLPLFNVSDVDISKFNISLKKYNTFLLVSTHILDSDKLIPKDYSHIKLFNPTFDMDLHKLFPEIDILITDYSSIITDFLLLRRPILFHIPDYDYYFNYGLNIDFKSLLPGTEIRDIIELQKIVEKKLILNTKKRETKIYLNMFYDTSIKNSSGEYLNYINNLKLR